MALGLSAPASHPVALSPPDLSLAFSPLCPPTCAGLSPSFAATTTTTNSSALSTKTPNGGTGATRSLSPSAQRHLRLASRAVLMRSAAELVAAWRGWAADHMQRAAASAATMSSCGSSTSNSVVGDEASAAVSGTAAATAPASPVVRLPTPPLQVLQALALLRKGREAVAQAHLQRAGGADTAAQTTVTAAAAIAAADIAIAECSADPQGAATSQLHTLRRLPVDAATVRVKRGVSGLAAPRARLPDAFGAKRSAAAASSTTHTGRRSAGSLRLRRGGAFRLLGSSTS